MWSCVSWRAQRWGAMSSPPSPGSAWESLASSGSVLPRQHWFEPLCTLQLHGKRPSHSLQDHRHSALYTEHHCFWLFSILWRQMWVLFFSIHLCWARKSSLSPPEEWRPISSPLHHPNVLHLLNWSWNLKSSGSGRVYHHQFSLKFLCLWGFRITEVSFSLTKQHPLLSLCYREH